MKLKLVGMLILVGAAAVACKTTTIDDSLGGSGGTGSTTTSTKASTSSKATVTSTGSSTMSTASGATGACDDIGTCQGDGMTPSSGCLECSINGTTDMYTDGGDCQQAFLDAYGQDGMCGMGGQQGACDFLACGNACDTNMSGSLDTAAELMCFCTSSNGTSCDMTQSDPNTCIGALEANQPAYNAEVAFETCVYQTVCATSCM